MAVHELHSVARLYDAALLAMHQRVQALPEARRQMLEDTLSAARPLAGKRVLIVDDDMRNIFALATVLEEHAMDIVWADNGRGRKRWDAVGSQAWLLQGALGLVASLTPK